METKPKRGIADRLLRWTLLVLVLAAAIAAWFAWSQYRTFSDTPVTQATAERTLLVARGDSFRDVLAKLRAAGIDEGHDLQWQALALEMDVVSRLQVGEYDIGHGITPRALLRKLERGRVIQHRFTIVEGWNFRQLRAALGDADALDRQSVGLDDAQLMARLGYPDQHPEGRFLPETYRYTRGSTDIALLKRAHLAMQQALAEAWKTRDADLPLTSAHDALVLASIIEKETGAAAERPQIAGVFIRRLRLGMLLQTDPTVIYGIGAGYDGNIRRTDLRTDTPYNTYRRAGLPPTPIAMPGRAALHAATHPAPGAALYFVARGDGSHVFSDDLGAHNRAVACYQLKRCR